MFDGEPMGALTLYFDKRHDWNDDDMQLLERIAEQGSTVVRNAENYNRMATWAAQLHSIQQLGARPYPAAHGRLDRADDLHGAQPAHRVAQHPRVSDRRRRVRARGVARRGRRVRRQERRAAAAQRW